MTFTGFPQGLAILDELPGWSKDEFATRRGEFDDQIMEPLRDLVADLGARLRDEVSPGIAAEPKVNGSISPINRDLRFAKDQSSIYRDHVMVNFWEGSPKKTAPTLRMRLWTGGVGVAAGAAFSPDALNRWRAVLASAAGIELRDMLSTLEAGGDLSVSDPELKKPPKEFPEDHPAADLARHKTFQVRLLEPVPKSVADASFVGWSMDRLLKLAPVHLWLVRHTG